MIEEIIIRDLGVIGEARLQMGSGFTALTGETGAGKTMILTALGLLLGERSDSGSVRKGQSQAQVHGLWKLEGTEAGEGVAARLEAAGIDYDLGELIISRTVAADGKSRASISAQPVPAGLLAELGESSRYTIEPLMISEVLDGWVDDLKTLQPERVIEVTNTQTRPVLVSRELFEQLFTNVFSNLKSHTDAGDRVQIVVDQNADRVSITVDDAGPGMERLLDGAVIDRFERFDVDHAKKPGSSGLGLSIMARIVELHGGTMTMTRSVLGGVRLSVQIPDGQPEELSKVSNRESSATP